MDAQYPPIRCTQNYSNPGTVLPHLELEWRRVRGEEAEKIVRFALFGLFPESPKPWPINVDVFHLMCKNFAEKYPDWELDANPG